MAVREPELRAQAAEPVPLRVPLLVVAGLADERVQVEPVRAHPAGHDHQRAARDQRVAVDERRGAVGGELGGAEPLQQHELDRLQRQAREQRHPAAEVHQDHQRRDVHDVVGQDVARLVAEHRPQLELVEQVERARGDDDHRRAGADRRGVRDGHLRQVEVVALGQVEPGADRVPVRPHRWHLVLAELDRGREVVLPVRALEAELDQLAHDDVEQRDLRERGGRRPVGGVLVGLGRDVGEPLVLGERGHPPGR